MLTGQILLQLIVILLVVQLSGYVCRKLGQQWVIGEIIAGIALGPSVLGLLWPEAKDTLFPVSTLPLLHTLGELGLILYMFSLGASLDRNHMLHQRRSAVIVSLSGIILPLFFGMLLGMVLYPTFAGEKATQFSFMLILGTAMAITAFPVLARLLHEKRMLSTKVGVLALTCAAVDDVIAWCLLAFVIAVASAKAIDSVGITVGLTILFIVTMVYVVRPLLSFAQKKMPDQFLLALCVILLLSSAYVTNAIGIHAIFGAFIMGIILPRRAAFIRKIRSIDSMNAILFLPLFFVFSGLRTQIGLIDAPALWLLCFLIFIVACAGKIVGGTFSSRIVGKSWKDSFTLGLLMNMRGLVELIVLNIGLELGILSPTIFTMLVIMALATTMVTPSLLPLLGYKNYPPTKKEQYEKV